MQEAARLFSDAVKRHRIKEGVFRSQKFKLKLRVQDADRFAEDRVPEGVARIDKPSGPDRAAAEAYSYGIQALSFSAEPHQPAHSQGQKPAADERKTEKWIYGKS